ncbi:MAG: hypothetical protein WC560_05385 [Syntrophales bacterium]
MDTSVVTVPNVRWWKLPIATAYQRYRSYQMPVDYFLKSRFAADVLA